MLLAVRMEQWRLHRLARRSVSSNQRTPQCTSDSRSHNSLPDSFWLTATWREFPGHKNENTDKIGSIVGRPFFFLVLAGAC